MKKYGFAVLAAVLLMAGGGLLPLPVDSAPLPAGTVRCYFWEPYGGTYHFLYYPQPASYKGTVTVEASGDPENPPSGKPVKSFELAWATVREKGNYQADYLDSSSGYSAILSGGSSLEMINGESVELAGKRKTVIGQSDATYKLRIMKDGAEVTSCSVDTTLNVRWIRPYVSPAAEKVSFPGESSFQVSTSRGTSTVATKFAPPIKDIIIPARTLMFGGNVGLETYIGNHFKNIFWAPISWAGPGGRWNISDPWNPKEPDVVGITHGSCSDAYKGQPRHHWGPYNNGLCSHAPQFSGGAVGEFPDGEGRFNYLHNGDGHGSISVLQFPAVGGGSIGQQHDPDWRDAFVQAYATSKPDGQHVIDATENENFFLYAGGSANGYKGDKYPLYVWDITSLNGDVQNPYTSEGDTVKDPNRYLKPKSLIGWQDITELQVVTVPGVKNHFLIARSEATRSLEANPKIMVGEIDASSGRIKRSNSFTLPLKGIIYRAPNSPGSAAFPGSHIQFASSGNNTYIFMTEQYTRKTPNDTFVGTVKVGVYALDPEKLTFTRKGSISLPEMGWGAVMNDSWKIVRSDKGDAMPMLAAMQISAYKTGYNESYKTSYTTPHLQSLNLYGLGNILKATSTVELTPQPDIRLPAQVIKFPMQIGQVLVNEWPYHPFLVPNNNKVDLYVYRHAFLLDGRCGGDRVIPYFEMPCNPAEQFDRGTNTVDGNVRGVASMRIEKMDVTAWTKLSGTTTTPPAPPVPPIPPVPPVTLPPATVTSSTCINQYRNLCDQITTLKEQICRLSPESIFCK